MIPFIGGQRASQVVKNPLAKAGDIRDEGLILGSGRAPGRGHGNPLQYSSLENPMDRGAWWATVHGVAKSWTERKQLSTQHRFIETESRRVLSGGCEERRIGELLFNGYGASVCKDEKVLEMDDGMIVAQQ